jgi:hypothetical protein
MFPKASAVKEFGIDNQAFIEALSCFQISNNLFFIIKVKYYNMIKLINIILKYNLIL